MKKGDPLVIGNFTNLDGNSIEKELCHCRVFVWLIISLLINFFVLLFTVKALHHLG